MVRGYFRPMSATPHLTQVAVLGGGQLGTMLAEAAAPLRIRVHCLDPDADAPARYNAQSFAEGDIRDARTVEAFGKRADVVTIEIEAVSTEGMRRLREDHGRAVYPSPEALEIIQDKGRQKEHYREHGIPTAPFAFYNSAEEVKTAVEDGKHDFPFVQKARTGGYDGKGVKVLRGATDLADLLQGPCLVEDFAPYIKELAVVVARRPSGEVKSYPVVEMDFDPEQNLVTQLISPARIDTAVAKIARTLAERTAASFETAGLLAVELFLLEDGSLWVNEVAPRPHNSGHITMDGFASSQFEQHLRAVLDWPLASTEQYRPAVMLNLLGEDSGTGEATYPGLGKALALPGVHVHLYGKRYTKPHRKMGHVNVVAETLDEALGTAAEVRELLRVAPTS